MNATQRQELLDKLSRLRKQVQDYNILIQDCNDRKAKLIIRKQEALTKIALIKEDLEGNK